MPTPQRLPTVNSDDGTWGDILRQYLKKEHYDDGTDNAVNGGHQNITVRAGSTAAGTAPIKLTSGALMTTPEAGAVEFLTDKIYFTKSTGPTRTTIATYDDTSGATGDIYHRNSGGLFTRLGIGSTGDLLTVASGIPSWTSSIVGKALDNTNTVTLKDTNFTLQDDGDTTKQAKFELSGITTGTTRTYTLPDRSATLTDSTFLTNVVKSIATNNMVVDPTFSTPESWVNGFGVMDTGQVWGGTYSRKITASGAGPTTDRLWLTHDGTGTQIKIPVDSDITTSPSPMQVNLRARLQKGGSNTGSAAPAIRWGIYWYNTAGAEAFVEMSNITEAAIATGGSWSFIDSGAQVPAAAEFFSVAIVIESAVPSGNIYYIDSAFASDYSLLRNWLNIQNKTIGNSNAVTQKDTSFTLQDATDTTKQVRFDVATAQTTATTRTITLPTVDSTLATLAGSETLTSKRINPRINTTTSSATPAINVDTTDQFNITALTTNITSMSASGDSPAGNLTGTPVDGQKLMIRIKGDSTPRTITWGPKYASSGVATLLATTAANKTHLVGLIYDSVTAKWVCVAVDTVGY
jgi:hypothetical protein